MEQQVLKVKNETTIEGNLTESQIIQLLKLASEKTTVSRDIKGVSVGITVSQWQKENRNRLYINKDHSKSGYKIFGSQPTACWIDVNGGQIHAERPAYGSLLILAELFGLEIYFGGGLRAVAE